jgi:hypothetical protein
MHLNAPAASTFKSTTFCLHSELVCFYNSHSKQWLLPWTGEGLRNAVCFVWGRKCVFLYLEKLQDLKGYFNEPNEEQEVETETGRMEGNFRNILPNNMTANVLSTPAPNYILSNFP